MAGIVNAYSVRPAQVVQFHGIKFWAERGRIHSERQSDGDYKSMSVKQCLERLKGINDMTKNSLHRAASKDFFFYGDELVDHQRFIDEMIALCKEAQDQGSPDDPSSVRAANRAKKTVVIPNVATAF